MTKPILRIAITGGAGQIAYQLLFRLAQGELFGLDQPLALNLLEIPDALASLKGVEMEMQDCAFPLLHQLKIFSDPYQAFKDIDYALLIGAKPRVLGMERKDLLQENGKIFVEQGQALNEVAAAHAQVWVIGNPCNTNCLIALSHAPRLSRKNFYAMMRLDQNRATALLAQKGHVPVQDISHMIVWGNHSSTQVPDFTHARLQGQPVETVIQDRHWLENDFFELIQKRGVAIIQARGKSSAASAAQAILDSVKDRLSSVQAHSWFSVGLDSLGNPYGIDEELIFSFPCHVLENKAIEIISNLKIEEFLEAKIRLSERELLEERDLVRSLIK